MIHHINSAKLGNQKAFNSLYDFYWKSVYGFMLNRTKNETLSHDITHEAFAKAFIKIDSYKSEYEFSTWLITIAKNLHFNLLRKKDPTFIDIYASSISFADTSPSPEDALIMNENYQRFLNSINQLRPNYREVIVLRERGLSFDEIVSITGDSYSNVRTKLSRARGILTCHLQKQC
jgi:RNA polymerase sigma-70 factor (ECF subfamily)